MKKYINLNKDDNLKAQVTGYGFIAVIVIGYVYALLQDETSIIYKLNIDTEQLAIYINLLCIVSVVILIILVIIKLCLYYSMYLYVHTRYNISYASYKDFRDKVARIQKGLKTSLKRMKADVNDVFPDIALKFDGSTYTLHLYKNHWFDKDQVDNNTDFFKSVIKLPIYSTEEDYDKITLTFTLLDTLMPYEKLYNQFPSSVEKGILVGHNGEKPRYWSYREIPHLLGAGTTGSGKSNFMKIVVDGIESIGAKMKFADGKRVELIRYRFKGYEVYTENFKKLFQSVHKIMMDRYKRMEQETMETMQEVNHFSKLKKPPKDFF